MQVIKPTPSQAAFVLKRFLQESGIEIQLGKAQEAIARVNGYTDWNSLASVMDPKVGEPKSEQGCLRQHRPNQYELMSEKGSSVWLQVDEIDVYVECGERGVDVLLYPHSDRPHQVECLDAAQASFEDAKEAIADAQDDQDDPEGNNASDKRQDDLFVLLLTADRVQTSNTFGPVRIESKNLRGLQAVIDGADPDDFDFAEAAFTFRNQGEVQNISLGALIEASYLGETGWVLPSGTELWVHQPKETPSDAVSAEEPKSEKVVPEAKPVETAKSNIFMELLTGEYVQLANTRGPTEFQKNEWALRNAAAGMSFKSDTGTWGIRFVDFDGVAQTIGMASLTGAYRRREAWDLPSGAELWIHQPADALSAEAAERRIAAGDDLNSLIERLLIAKRVRGTLQDPPLTFVHKDMQMLRAISDEGIAVLQEAHPFKPILTYRTGDKTLHVGAAALLGAKPYGTTGWILGDGRTLFV